MWDNVTIGMKLEVENKDIDPRNHQIAFWVASVVKIQGYMVLLRFEGFANDTSGDFWINLCSHDIHHVGWCANKGKPLIPPRCKIYAHTGIDILKINNLNYNMTHCYRSDFS